MEEEFREVTLEDCKEVVNIESISYMLHVEKGISIEKAKEFVDSLDETELNVMIDESARVLFEDIFRGVKVFEESEKFLFLELDSMIKAGRGLENFNAWVEKYGMEDFVVRGKYGYVVIPKRNLFTN